MNVIIPQTISDNAESLISANSALVEELSSLQEALAAVPVLYDSPIAPLSVSASIADGIRDILYKGASLVAIHPWIYTAGEIEGGVYSAPNNAYLTPKNAIAHLRNKLTDPNDNSKDRTAEIVYILLSSDKLDSFALQLDALSTVLSLGEIEFCLRRAIQLLELTEKKFIKKTPFINPHWRSHNISQGQRNLTSKIEQLSAFNDSSAEDVAPVTELQEVIDGKISELNDIEAAWRTLDISHSLTGASGYFSGTASSIADQLKSVSVNDNKYSFLFAIIANTAGDLNYFREAFGI